MDIDKAREAHLLYAKRDELKAAALMMRSRMEKGPGTTTVTIPTSWLPAIIEIAERDIEKIDNEINEL